MLILKNKPALSIKYREGCCLCRNEFRWKCKQNLQFHTRWSSGAWRCPCAALAVVLTLFLPIFTHFRHKNRHCIVTVSFMFQVTFRSRVTRFSYTNSKTISDYAPRHEADSPHAVSSSAFTLSAYCPPHLWHRVCFLSKYSKFKKKNKKNIHACIYTQTEEKRVLKSLMMLKHFWSHVGMLVAGGGGDWMEFWIKQSLNSDSLHAASVLYSPSSHFWHRVTLGLGWKDKLYETSYWKATQDVLNSKLPLDHFCSQCVPLQDQKCLDVIIIDAMEQLLSWLTSQNLIK